MPIVSVAHDDSFLDLGWADGSTSRHALIWLRDNDPAGFHPDTGERVQDLLGVPDMPQATAAQADGDALRLVWSDGHEGVFPEGFLAEWADVPAGGRDAAPVAPESWDGSFADRLPRHDGGAILHDDGALLSWLEDLARFGLTVVEDVRPETGALEDLCRRIAHLRETNFGVIFEVKSIPKPNNQAYTADALPLHSDLANQETPPGFQFLHTLENDAEGGLSVFADGMRIAEHVRDSDPEAYRLLRDVDIPYRFHDSAWDIRKRRPVIREDAAGVPCEVNFNAHLADVFDLTPEETVAYYRAYRIFMAETRDPRYEVRLKMRPGEMAAFDNRRTLHGRSAFDPSTGRRLLRGCYVDRTDLHSRIRVLRR